MHFPAHSLVPRVWAVVVTRVCFPGQAFEIVARPALDSAEAAVDRVKMNIYLKFAEWGLPCPITGHQGGVVRGGEGSAVRA